MSEKETSGEIATIAGRILNISDDDRHVPPYSALLADAKRLAGSALSQREIIQAQVDGEDIFELGQPFEMQNASARVGDFIVSALVGGGLNVVPAVPQVEQSNFDLYVDGYTLKGTDKIGEILVTSPDGANVVIKSSQLTAFLERRLTPGNFPPE